MASFIACTVPVEKGHANTLLESAQNIGQPAAGRITDGGDGIEQPHRPGEPRVGSYEAFMGSFGSPRRWAGSGG